MVLLDGEGDAADEPVVNRLAVLVRSQLQLGQAHIAAHVEDSAGQALL